MVSLCWYLWDIASAITDHHSSIQLEQSSAAIVAGSPAGSRSGD